MGSTAEGSAAEMNDDDGTPSGATLPFDAVANLRLLAEVQRRGVDAANLVIARLTERTNTASTGPAGADPADQLATLTDAFIDSVAAVAGAMMPMVDPLTSAAGTGARRDEPTGPEVLAAQGDAGQSLEVELWLHNYTDEMATGIELHLSDLVQADGARLPTSCVTPRPSSPFDLSATSSRPVTLRVDVPSDAAPGRYRGIVTAAHLPDLWVVLQVEVRAAHTETSATGAPPPDPSS